MGLIFLLVSLMHSVGRRDSGGKLAMLRCIPFSMRIAFLAVAFIPVGLKKKNPQKKQKIGNVTLRFTPEHWFNSKGYVNGTFLYFDKEDAGCLSKYPCLPLRLVP